MSQVVSMSPVRFLESELRQALARHCDEFSAAGDSRVTRLRLALAEARRWERVVGAAQSIAPLICGSFGAEGSELRASVHALQDGS